MREIIRLLFILFISATLVGCIRLSNSKIDVQKLGKIDSHNKNITMLNTTGFTPDLIQALAVYGFKIKPVPIQYTEEAKIGKNKIIAFNKASARYGLTTYVRTTSMRCVFSENEVVKATLTVTDLRTGDVVLTIEQEGADGPCPPMKSIWGGLAESLAKNW